MSIWHLPCVRPPALDKQVKQTNEKYNETDDETYKRIFSFRSYVFMRVAHGQTCDWVVRFFATAVSLSWKCKRQLHTNTNAHKHENILSRSSRHVTQM